MARRIHITGASGCGVTTLGAALAGRLGLVHLDTDEFYWLPTDPAYIDRRPIKDRLAMLDASFAAAPDGWVLSGSMDGWGDPLIPLFDVVLFLRVPGEVRVARIAARERTRNGDAVEPGGALHAASKAFMDWSAAYDASDQPGRSLQRHEAWLSRLPCPVLRLDGLRPTAMLVEQVLSVHCDAAKP